MPKLDRTAKAIKAFNNDHSQENSKAMLDELTRTTFLVPVGTIVSRDDEQEALAPIEIFNIEGAPKPVLIAFTSRELASADMSKSIEACAELDFAALLEFIKNNKDKMGFLLINPSGPTIVFEVEPFLEHFKSFRHIEKKEIEAGEVFRFTDASALEPHLSQSIRSICESEPDIEKAWLVYDQNDHYAIIVESASEDWRLLERIATRLSELQEKRKLMMAFTSSDLARDVAGTITPLFEHKLN